MIYPSIDDLTKGGVYNRYELVIATAKAARIITDAEVEKKEEMEKNAAKESPQANSIYSRMEIGMIDERRDDKLDEKAVKIAIQKIYNGEFLIKI